MALDMRGIRGFSNEYHNIWFRGEMRKLCIFQLKKNPYLELCNIEICLIILVLSLHLCTLYTEHIANMYMVLK